MFSRSLLPITAAFLLLSVCIIGRAQNPMAPANPTMPSRERERQKDLLYSQYYEHRKMPSAEDQRIAYELAKDYLRRYGGDETDPDLKSIRKFVSEYEKLHAQSQLDAAVAAKNYPQAFQIGRTLLKNDPENFYVLAMLGKAGYENALAGDPKLNIDTIDYLRHAIQIVESGKLAKPDPFKDAEAAKGFLNFTLGWFLREQFPVEAAAAFRKAAQTDGPYRTNSEVYYRMGVAILKGELAELSTEYNQKFGSKPPSPEQTAMLERIKQLAGRAIDAYARAVALSSGPEQRDARAKILAQLTALYKSFHNDSDAGLSELLADVLSKPLP
jgi:hypothetical protein